MNAFEKNILFFLSQKSMINWLLPTILDKKHPGQ